MTKTRVQKLKSKIGEVNYRSKLVSQYQDKKVLFENEPSHNEMIQVLKERIKSTKKDLALLKKNQVKFSPYLEIGAEFGHRAAVVEERYKAKGFALDISLESLAQMPFFAKELKLKKIPKRICADAYHLPFQNNSFNFIFCYQTLHHFPDPSPVVKEVFRVLAPGGYFFVNEEPVSQAFNLKLWRRPTKLRRWEKILKYILVLPFISTIGKTETDHGILEETFDLKTWERSLDNFENATVFLKPYPIGPGSRNVKNSKSGWLKPNLFSLFFVLALGGGIKILARKSVSIATTTNEKVDNLIACPTCLGKLDLNLHCIRCKFDYPKSENIKILLSEKTLGNLYSNLKK